MLFYIYVFICLYVFILSEINSNYNASYYTALNDSLIIYIFLFGVYCLIFGIIANIFSFF